MTNEHEKLPSGKLADDKPLPSDICCTNVRRHGGWYSAKRCGKKAKVTHKGKHYCGIHDPVRREAKADERWKERNAEWEAQRLEREAQNKLIADGRKYLALEPLLRELCTYGLIEYRGEGWNTEVNNITARIRGIVDGK